QGPEHLQSPVLLLRTVRRTLEPFTRVVVPNQVESLDLPGLVLLTAGRGPEVNAELVTVALEAIQRRHLGRIPHRQVQAMKRLPFSLVVGYYGVVVLLNEVRLLHGTVKRREKHRLTAPGLAEHRDLLLQVLADLHLAVLTDCACPTTTSTSVARDRPT